MTEKKRNPAFERDITPDEERELMELSEKEDGWISSPDIEKDRAFWREAAKQTLDGKRRRISR